MLSRIKTYLQNCGQASLADIALHINASPDAVRGMLENWVRKGKVERRMLDVACGISCKQCDPLSTEHYIWLEATDKISQQADCKEKINGQD